MPNWCKGSLKVRGTKASLKTFILEGLHPVGFLGEEREKLSLNEYGDIYSEETCWIENTRRGFVEGVEVYLSDHEDDEILVVVFDSKFAWGINASELLETCIKYLPPVLLSDSPYSNNNFGTVSAVFPSFRKYRSASSPLAA